jgi:hypothetical protein
MEALSATEIRIIRSMLEKRYGRTSGFLTQLENASAETRRSSGVGIFVELRVAAGAGAVDGVNAEISEAYTTRYPPPGDLVEFTLFIRGGRLALLEGYTFGDAAWPEAPMADWLILESAAEQRAG